MLVVGLGNPGQKYALTRHNLGFRVVDRLSKELHIYLKKKVIRKYSLGKGEWCGKKILLAKPLTYMNRSGEIINPLMETTGTGLSELLVVCDTLDLPPGICRLKRKGSSGGHRGLESIIRNLGSEEFLRMYIGIGKPRNKEEVISYVLEKPVGEEAGLLEKATIEAADCILKLLEKPPEIVMNEINRKKR